MANPDSHVTIHMAASLDGFIARKDGRVDGSKPPTNSQAGRP
jgi:riboflavin biosynthesis pyrimidine reductase